MRMNIIIFLFSQYLKLPHTLLFFYLKKMLAKKGKEVEIFIVLDNRSGNKSKKSLKSFIIIK